MAIVDVKNKFCIGHHLELMTPKGNVAFTLDYLLDYNGNRIDDAKGSGHQVRIPVPNGISLDYALLLRNLESNQTTRQPFSNSTPELA